MPLDTAYINGNAVSWGNLLWRVTLPDMGGMGGRLFGFYSFDFGGEKRDRKHVYAQSEDEAPIALSAGQYIPPFPKVGFLAHTLDADETAPYTSLITLLSRGAPDGISYGDVRMYWLLQVNSGVMRGRYEWFDVYLTEPSASWEPGQDGLKREVGFACLRHRVNGKTLYRSTPQ